MSRRRMMLANQGQEEDEVKKWETIIDYTVPDTVMNVSLDKDLDGNPFRLSELSVLCICEKTEETSSYGISFCPTKKYTNSTALVNSCKNTDTRVVGLLHYQQCGFGLIPTLLAKSVNSTNIWNTMGWALPANGFMLANSNTGIPEYPDTCEGIWIGSYYQPAMQKGTRIIVRGIRC